MGGHNSVLIRHYCLGILDYSEPGVGERRDLSAISLLTMKNLHIDVFWSCGFQDTCISNKQGQAKVSPLCANVLKQLD